MVARSRSSLMCLQSDYLRDSNYAHSAQEELRHALEHSRQRLKSRCKHLEEAFCPNTARKSHGDNTPHSCLLEEGRNIDITPSERRGVSGSDRVRCSHIDFSHLVREEHNRSTTPRRILLNGDSSRKHAHLTPTRRIHQDRCGRKYINHSPVNRRVSVSSSLKWCFEREPGRYSLQDSIPPSESSHPESLHNFIPLDVLLASKLGVGTSTLSCDRSFTLIDCPDQHSPQKHGLHADGKRRLQEERAREIYQNHDRHIPREHQPYQHRRVSQANSYYNRAWKSSRRQDLRHHQGHHKVGNCNRSIHYVPQRIHRRTANLQDHRRHRYKMASEINLDEAPTTSSIDEVERAATSCIGPTRSGAVQRSPQSQSLPRILRPKTKADTDYLGRLMSGSAVNLDLLKAPERGSSESARYTISICREIFMGVIGAQMVYVVTSLMFGNIAAALIVSLLCVQSAFCHCDGRPVAYMVNGFLCLMVGTTVAVALCRNVSGLEPYRTDPVLHTMSYIYVPLCYVFGCFSFFLGYGYQKLHKQERRAIVQAVNRLVGDRYQVNERSLTLERRH